MVINSSDEWSRVPNSEKEKMELKVEDDGEFWSAISNNYY